MNRRTFCRRRLLVGAGGVTVALPFLEALDVLRPSRAIAQTPRRLVVFFTPEGTQAKSWFPTGTMNEFTLGPLMQPLETHKRDLVVFRGIDHQSCKDVGSDHFKSMVHMLTGGSPDSIDQVVAAQIGKGQRFTSLELAVRPRNTNEKGIMVYAGGKMVPGEYNPVKVFARLFTGGVAPGAGVPIDVQEIFARRKSVVDFVKGQLDATKKLLGAEDRARLDEHLAAIRDVERSLTTPPEASTAECANPSVMPIEGGNTSGPPEKLLDVQIDLLVLALACRMTNVISLQFLNSGTGEPFGWLGVPSGMDGLHGWVHNDKGNPVFPEYARKTFAWFADRYAHLVGKLKAVRDGAGTLLDESAVVWATHFGNGGGHTPTNVPWVIAGSAGGAWKTGRYLDFGAAPEPHNRLLIGIAHAFGVKLDKLGNPKYGTSPLPGLLG